MNIQWVTLRVKDMNASREFYGGFLQMKLAREFTTPDGMKFSFYEAENGMQIELVEGGEAVAPCQGASRISIGLSTAGYDEILNGARFRDIITQEPAKLGGQLECFFISDPDGFSLQIARA